MALMRRNRTAPADTAPAIPTEVIDGGAIPDNDPLFAFLLATGGPVEVDRINISSPALEEIREQGIQLIVPLISQGELIGTLSLGRRLSEQPYSTDDRKLLAGLAGQVAPAIRVAQLVRQQEAEAKERERIDQELRVAALIQQTLLPKELPQLDGWEIEAYYQSARAVGGDFYDFIPLTGGRIGLVIGDVTDKGVPAALVMATTRSTLRSMATQHDDPGRGSRPGQRISGSRDPARRCSSPASTEFSIRKPATSSSPTPDTTFPTSAPPQACARCAPAGCPSV